MPLQRYEMTLDRVKNDYDEVHSYYFNLSQELSWIPGQYIHLIAPGCEIKKGVTVKHMSIASIPEEKQLLISMDLSSKSFYKQQFSALTVGDPVNFFKVKGHFVLEPEMKEVVFVAGGIGITPIRSMIMSIEQNSLPVSWSLLHVARSGHLYEDEMASFSNPQVRTNRAGHADALQAMVDKYPNACYFICGSAGFIEGLYAAVVELGIDASHIRTENFK